MARNPQECQSFMSVLNFTLKFPYSLLIHKQQKHIFKNNHDYIHKIILKKRGGRAIQRI